MDGGIFLLMVKKPSFQFYPGDWLRDPVSGCCLAAQGLWLRMMIIMHDSERYGYLSLNGHPMKPEVIARRCGCTDDEYKTLFAELETAGVPRITNEGIVFSKRMTEDEKHRKNWSVRQRKKREKQNVTLLSHKCHAVSSPSSSFSVKKEHISSTQYLIDRGPPDSGQGHMSDKNKTISQPTVSKRQKHEASFERFWSVWEKRIDKAEALQVWCRLEPDEELLEMIVKDVEIRMQSEEWTKENRQYCPSPARYLRRRKWEDQVICDNRYAFLDEEDS